MSIPRLREPPLRPLTEPLSDPAGYLDRVAECFGRVYDEGGDVWTEERAMRCAPRLLRDSLPAGARALDVGAGRGRDAALLAASGCHVVGIDLVPLPEWAQLEATFGNRLEFRCGSLQGAALDGDFDAVLDNGCFHHQHPREVRAFLTRIAELLHQKGTFCLSVFTPPSHRSPQRLTTDLGRMNIEYSPSELRTLLVANGFRVRETHVVERDTRGRYYLVVLCTRV